MKPKMAELLPLCDPDANEVQCKHLRGNTPPLRHIFWLDAVSVQQTWSASRGWRPGLRDHRRRIFSLQSLNSNLVVAELELERDVLISCKIKHSTLKPNVLNVSSLRLANPENLQRSLESTTVLSDSRLPHDYRHCQNWWAKSKGSW